MDNGFYGLQSCRYDETGSWLNIHDRLLQKLGHSRQALCADGGGLFALLSEEDRPAFRRELDRQTEQDGLFSLSGRFRTKDGAAWLRLQGERRTQGGQARLCLLYTSRCV